MNNGEIIKKYSKWSFLGLFGKGHGSSDSTQIVDSGFNKSLIIEYQYKGGNINMRANQYSDWTQTIKQSPDVIMISILPITQFVKNLEVKG